jgi:hypothetical protein
MVGAVDDRRRHFRGESFAAEPGAIGGVKHLFEQDDAEHHSGGGDDCGGNVNPRGWLVDHFDFVQGPRDVVEQIRRRGVAVGR